MARCKVPDEEKCVKVSISFQPDQLEQLQRYCQKEERSMSWVIRKALVERLPKHLDEEVAKCLLAVFCIITTSRY